MRRLIWFLVAAMTLLVVVLMLTLGTPPAEEIGALIVGSGNVSRVRSGMLRIGALMAPLWDETKAAAGRSVLT
jgi:hypothetical protein